MIINNLIKKGFLTNNVMLTSATIATEEQEKLSIVADVAIVAAGNSNSYEALSNIEKQKIISWLEFIGERDPFIIIEVLESCSNNVDSRQYFLQRAKEESEIK